MNKVQCYNVQDKVKKMKKNINNQNRSENPVGHFMLAAGAILEYKNTGKILVQKRSSAQDWQADEWEIPYGRLAQFEDVYTGLKREIKEETGIDDIQILKPIRIWHLFRGFKKTAENELIGITFHCRTNGKKASYSSEHTTSRWVTPKKALEFIKVPGIKKDIKVFIKL